MLVIAAARGFQVEQVAGDGGRIDAARVLILQLVQTAFAAAVSQRLPLSGIEGRQRRLPKGARGRYFTHFANSAAAWPGAPSSGPGGGPSTGVIARGLSSGSMRKGRWCGVTRERSGAGPRTLMYA